MKLPDVLLALALGAGACNWSDTHSALNPAAAPAVAPVRPSVEQVQAQVSSHAVAVQELATQVSRLAPEWDDLVQEYKRAAEAHEAAQRKLREADQYYATAHVQHERAAQAAERAMQEWKLAQALIVAAAAMDEARVDAARAYRASKPSHLSCADGMTPHAYRVQQAARWVSLVGKDVGHIVPRSLGGADHPDNYKLIPASENRSLGNTWNRDVCNSYGAERCARAIAVSRKCGTLRGLGF